MATKPSYIGLLNAIANGERGGHQLFSSWSGATKNKKLKATLDMVAIREMEHSWAFEKRLCELGYSVRPTVNKTLAKQVKLLKSNASDKEKFASFGIGGKRQKKKADVTDNLLKILADKTIDAQTGELMGRFICEERDTGRQLTKAYKATQQKKNKNK